MMQPRIERIRLLNGFENSATEARFQRYFSATLINVDFRHLFMGLAFVSVWFALGLAGAAPMPAPIWFITAQAILAFVLWLNVLYPHVYLQHRTSLLFACKILRIVLLVAFGREAVCWPKDRPMNKWLAFVISLEKNGRIIFMFYMGVVGQIAFMYEVGIQSLLMPLSLAMVKHACQPACLYGMDTNKLMGFARQMVFFLSNIAEGGGYGAAPLDLTLNGDGEKSCVIILAWLQISFGCLAPLCLLYCNEKRARLDWAASQDIQVEPPMEGWTVGIATFVFWCAFIMLAYILLEASYTPGIRDALQGILPWL